MTTAAAMRRDTISTAFCGLISVVVPLYDEEANLPELHRRLTKTLGEMPFDYELLFVNDGSHDATPRILRIIAGYDPHCAAVHLSRNFGHQAAVSAGLDHARGDAVIVMDGDLQDPPEMLPQLLERWREGYDVVYAVRRSRRENAFKKLGYYAFYRLMRSASDLDLPLDAGDFCLLDRKAVDALARLPERQRFVRGLRGFIGFNQVGVPYDRDARAAGTPKYTLRRLIGLAADGFFNFGNFPLRLVLAGGLGLLAVALLLIAAAVLNGSNTLGLFAAVAGTAGLQFLGMGILGEYLRRILLEVKGRPAYIVREVLRGDAAGSRAA